MNHIYKVIWNTVTQTWVAVSELSRAKGKTKSSKTLSAVVLAAVSAGAIVGDAEAARSSIPPGEVIENGMAIGPNSYANRNSVAYGVAAKANDGYAVAIGANAVTERVAEGSVGVADSRGQIAIGSNSYAKKEGDTAIGSNAKAEGQFSTAVGNGAKALGNNSSAFGEGAQAKADYSTALGKGAEAKEMYAIALGKESHAEKSFSTSVGFKTEAKGFSSLALGSGIVPSKDLTGDGKVDEDDIALNRTIADGNAAFAAGASANATGSYASALGAQSKATANAALAVGKMANASANSTIAVGDNAQASGEKATSIGAGAIAKNNGTIAIGDQAKVGATNGDVAATNGIAIGTESESKDQQAIAVGKKAIAAGNNSIALGNETKTTGGNGVAIGNTASASDHSAAIGNTASASHHSVAFGSEAEATAAGGYSSAFGQKSKATATDASAFGNESKALATNATSVGAHSKVDTAATYGSALGREASVTAANGTALGSLSSVTAADGTAVGTNATVTTAGGVALGQGSSSSRTALDKNKVKITTGHVENTEGISQNDDNNKNGDVYAPVKLIDKTEVLERVKNTILGSAGAVSLGKDDKTTRQLTNLAPGSKDSDAVNVAQLKAVVGSIVKYNVTSPDNSITIDPTSETDKYGNRKTTFNVKMNTDAVKNAAAWKIKANKETDNKATSVRGGDIVTFKAKDGGNSGDTIKITRNGKELTFEANFATIRTPGTGMVNVDNDVKDNWLAKAKNVAAAINASGWTLQANGKNVGLINPGNKVNIATDANSGITITPTNENADGVSTIKLKANVTGLTAGNNVTISSKDGNYTINAIDTNTQASVSKAANSPITINATGAANAKNYELDVAVDGTTIVKKDGKLTANVPDVSTTDLTVNNGKVTQPVADDGKKLVNATTVANAINKSYWKATRGTSDNTNDDKAEGDATSNIKAGDELTFVAGKNMALKKVGNTFTYGTKNDVSFNKVTSTEFVVNPNGKFTVGAGSTINMGDNIIHGVKAGVENTDAVNVAQLKANTSVVSAGDNITVASSTNDEGNKVYTVTAKNTQATVSKAEGDNPITLDNSTTNANGTTNYKVGLAIDNSTLEIKEGKLAAKAQAKAIETVESKDGADNIAEVSEKSNNKGTAGATYQVNVSKNTVKDAAREAVTVSDDKKTNVNSPITVTATKDEANHSTDYKVSFDGDKAAQVIPLTYKANGENAKTVKLSEGLDFTNGKGTKASVGDNGKVTFDANVTDITQGDNITVTKDNDGKYTISATDTNTQASVSKAANSPITINATGAANAKNYELDVAVDGTTIVKKDGKLTANVPDVSTTDLTVNNGKVTQPVADDGKKLVNATTVANAINKSYWKATRGTSDNTNDDKAEGDATSNIKAGDELTFVAGKNMALKKVGNTFTYGTKNDVSFNKVTSTEFVVNPNGKFTVGAGSTINMGDNIIHGVKAGVENTDAVNVAQLKANTSVVSAGDNITVASSTNDEGNKVYTVTAKNTQATVSKAEGDNPITLDNSTTNANGTTNYKVGLAIDNSTLEIKEGKLAAKAQAKAIETVESKDGADNIAEVSEKSNNKGTAGATYQVNVSKNTVKDAAREAVTVSDDKKTNVNSPITVTATKDEANHSTDYKVSFDGDKAAQVIPLTYKANGENAKTVKLSEGLDFTNGKGTKASVGDNGKVTFDANVTDITQGDNITVTKDNDGKYTISATDTNTQASVSKAANSPITINATGAANAKNYELDVAVDGTTIVKKDGKLTANVPDVSTTDLTVNNGKVTQPVADDGKKLVNATTVANAINKSYWKATRGTSDNTNDDKAEGDATSNIKAGDELTFVAGKNMALKKVGNTFTYGTKNDVSFNKVTSTEFVVNPNGKFTVGAGSTINMGDNIIHGVKAGVENTDAVNVAQLKANTSVVSAGDNITVASSTNDEGNKVYTVTAKNTQATVSKAEGDNPITLDNSTTNANGTTNYKVGLAIDNSTLEIKEGKLAAKAQAKAIETVESKDGADNIAEVSEKSNNKGTAGATYQVNVSKNTVKDAAREAVTVSDDKKTNVNSPITVTATKDEANHSTDYKVSFDGDKAAQVIPLTYKANGENAKTVKLSEGLDFTNGKGTKASVGDNGKVTFDANVTDITQGDNITVTKDNDGKYTISATDTNTQASVSKAANSPITINATGAANAKNYELDVAVDGTTIVKKDGKLTANVPDVSTTDLTVNNGKVTQPVADDGKKLVNATTVANAINKSYWKATRGTSDNTNDDKAEGDATSNIKAGDELTFVAGKNMALKKVGNTFTYGTKNDVSFNKVTSTEFVVNPNGKFTVGAGSTINMGDNIIHGVKAGVENTDAVNVAQLKANTTTVVAGKNVSVDVAENASTGKTFTVNADKTTVSGTGPVTVKATSDVANHTTNYNVEFDSSKAAEQTDLTYKANGKDAKKVKLSEGLDFTNGKGTKASVGENGKVTIDANVTDIAAGNNIQVNKGDDGKYTISSTNTITTVKGKDGSAAKVTTTTGSTDTNKIYEVDVNVDGKTIVNENGTLQAKGWKTKVVKGEGEVEGASEETVNGSDTVNYIAGKNVKLVQNGKNFTIATKDNVTFKDTTTTNLSVTTGGKVDMGNNKVTNVAEGTENTDAVNVKQLKDFKAEVADGGLTFAGNSGTAHKAKLNTTVNIKGGKDNTDATKFDNGKNVMTAVNGDTVTVSIKKTPEVEGINIIDTTGKVKVKLTQTDEGLKVSDGNNNATRITNVKAGEKDTDAVNVKQLNAAKTEVTAGDNIDVRSSTGANGQTIYKVSANDTSAAVEAGSDHVKVTKAANTHKDGSTTVTDYTVDLSDKTKGDIGKGVKAYDKVTNEGLTFNADKGSTGVKKLGSKVSVNGDGKNIITTADENGVKVSMKDDIKVNSVTAKEVKVGDVNINENGINAGGKRITNVAPGKDGTDAVNVNQLKYVAGNISNQINNVDKSLRAGIAGALASGGLYHVTTAGKSMVSVGAGTYRGQNALAVGYSRLSDNGKVGVKFTVNSNSQGHSGASASVGYQW